MFYEFISSKAENNEHITLLTTFQIYKHWSIMSTIFDNFIVLIFKISHQVFCKCIYFGIAQSRFI